jgi:hypothetical protein
MSTSRRVASYAIGPCRAVVRDQGLTIGGAGRLVVVILAALAIYGAVGVSTVFAQTGADPALPVSAPGAPENFRTLVGGWHLSVGWRPPADNGGSPITEYRLRYKRS